MAGLDVVGHVVGVRRPGRPRGRLAVGQWRRGRVVHRAEGVRRAVAGEVLRVENDVPESVAHARGHEPALMRGQVRHHGEVADRRVEHGHLDLVARVHQQDVGRGSEGRVGLLVRAWRPDRRAAVGQVREVDRLGAVGVGDRVRRAARPVQGAELGLQAVDGQRGAPVGLIARDGGSVAGRIELQLGERRPGVVGPRRHLDVAVAVGLADLRALGVALVVAHGQAEPDGRGELEFVDWPGERPAGRTRRVLGQHHLVAHAVTRPRGVGEEAEVWLVVADVVAVVEEAVLGVRRDLGAQQVPERLLHRAVAVAVQAAPGVDVLLNRAARRAMGQGG